MIFKKLQIIIVLIIITISLFYCKPEEIILHGDITGSVTDALTSEPIEAASVKINNTNDTTSTRNDGTYLLKNITPGDYEVQVSKFAYATSSKNIEVDPAKTKELNFALTGCAERYFSTDYLDFGLDSTSLSFTISNLGRGEFTYVLTTSQDWINVYPVSGEVTDETDIITVSVDKTGLSDSTYEENIQIVSVTLQGTFQDTIDIYLNGVMDIDGNYYEVVQIGTQIWMAENLNVGDLIFPEKDQTNNNNIEKFCYNNDWTLCKTYGGLYQ